MLYGEDGRWSPSASESTAAACRRAVAREIRDDQPPPGKERGQFGEVPRGAAEAVDEQQGRPLPALKGADLGPTPLVEPLFEAREENRRIRHVDRLFSDDYECEGDKAGRVNSLVLHREELEPQSLKT